MFRMVRELFLNLSKNQSPEAAYQTNLRLGVNFEKKEICLKSDNELDSSRERNEDLVSMNLSSVTLKGREGEAKLSRHLYIN